VKKPVQPSVSPVAGNTERTKPENRAFYPALDGLRALAFLLVFLHHYSGFPWGWAGVNIFFVLSGFLITGILYDTRDDSHPARNFYIRRALRIFPLYYGIVLTVLIFSPIAHWNLSGYWMAWPLYVANFLPFIPVNIVSGKGLQFAAYAWLKPANSHITFYFGHFWSLCVEEQFYFIWPWIVFSLRSRRALIWLCAVIVTAVPFLRFLCQATAPPWMVRADLLNRATPFQVDSLLLGGLIALLLRGSNRQQLFRFGTIAFACISALVLPYFVWCIVTGFPDWSSGYVLPNWKFTWGTTLINLFSAGLVLSCVDTSSAIHRLLCYKQLRFLGRISYGAYVFHDIFRDFYSAMIMNIASRVELVANHNVFFTSALALICTIFMSWLSFECFESMFLNLKERWTVQQNPSVLQQVSTN
jgi:peptidoglycan/LPS O-acetylase OafA/YrhL